MCHFLPVNQNVYCQEMNGYCDTCVQLYQKWTWVTKGQPVCVVNTHAYEKEYH